MVRFDRARLLDPALDAPTLERRAHALDLAEAALEAVDAERATAAAIERLQERGVRLHGATIFAFGKAAPAMARAALARIDVRGGIVIGTHAEPLPGLLSRIGGHPDPRPDAAATGREVMALARSLGPQDVALGLVSGGGSAMLELPVHDVAIDEIAALSRALMHAGADVVELNGVRQRLSQLKGGGLARAIAPAKLVNIVICDVPGAGPELVASGPTFAPRACDALGIVRARGIAVSPRIARLLAMTPPTVESAPTEIAADNSTARAAVVARGKELGLAIEESSEIVRGEARTIGAAMARERLQSGRVAGGEPTVRVSGAGRGGRNQELVLGAIAAGGPQHLLLSFGTDGIDGSSDAAGALVDPAAMERVRELRLDPRRALAENDSHTFFEALGTALRCGPTGTNVADLVLRLR